MKIMGPSFSDDELKIVSCENCGLVYSYSSASQKDYDCYYKSSFSKAVDYNMMFGEKETNDYCEHIYNIISDFTRRNIST